MISVILDTLQIASLAISLLAAVWARRAIERAERIRKSTAAGDRLEMERIARAAVRRAAEKPLHSTPATFDLRRRA